MCNSYFRHCSRCHVLGVRPLPYHKFIRLAEALATNETKPGTVRAFYLPVT